MAEIFNFTTLNISALDELHDVIVVDKYLGNPMPANFTENDYQNLKHIAMWYDIFLVNFDLARAYDTYVIRRILDDFDDRIKNLNSKALKWTALSVHDSNINALLNYLNISSSSCMEDLYRKNKTTALNCEPGP